jgi:tetratricopeptide (TPR) repeat protein
MKETPEVVGETVQALRRLVRVHPDDTQCVSRLVNIYLQVREFGLAEELAKSWTAAVPGSADAILAAARARHGLHKDSEAAQGLAEALTKAPGEARLYPPLIELLVDPLDRKDEAAEWLDKALHVGSESQDIQIAAFLFHHRTGDPAKAEEHLKRALALAPDAVEVLVPAAAFYLSRKDMDESDRLLRRAEATSPGNRMVLSARTSWAIVKNEPGRLEGTADELAASAGDTELDLLARAAELYLRAGRLDRADECIEKLSSAPRRGGRETLDVWLDTLRGARILLDGRPYAAIPLLDRAFRRQPSGLWAAELLALAYQRTGEPEEAAELYRRILQVAPDVTAARLALARVEWRQGRIREAREQVALLSSASGEEARQAELLRIACELRQALQEKRPPKDGPTLRKTLEDIAATRPSDEAVIGLLAQCWALLGESARAVELLGSWTANAPAVAGAATELGGLLLAEKQFEAAAALADQLLARFPDTPQGYVLRVRTLAQKGRLGDAAACVESCALTGPAKGGLWELLADEYAAADQPGPATAALRQAVALLPGSIGVRHKLIRRSESMDEARPLMEEIRSIEGEGGVHWKFERAWALLRHERARSAGEAVELLKQCLSARPAWVSARVFLGSAQEAAGALSEAADAYRAAITQRPELAADTVAIRLVEVLKRLGRFSEADAVLGPLSAALPDSPDVLRLEIDKQLRNRSVASAAATAERLLELRGDDPAWAGVTADLQLRAGNAAKAEQIARSALRQHPDSTPLMASVARAMIAQGQGDQAEAAVRDFSNTRADGVSHLLLAQVLMYLNKPAEAEHAIAAAIQHAPSDAVVYAAAADFWGARGDRSRQIAMARQAVELRGESAAESLPLATLLATGGTPAERAEAGAIVQRRLKANGQDAASLLLQAQLAATAQPPDFTVAEASAQKALAIEPQSVLAHKTLAAIQGRSGKVTPSGETIAAGLNVAPDDPELLLSSAQFHVHRGDYDEAIAPLRRLLRLRPRLPEALRLLTAAYQFAGQSDQAIAYLERQAPPEQWTPLETILLAKLYEAKKDLSRAEALLRRAVEMDKRSAEAFQEYVHYVARRGSLDQVYALASQRRAEFPDDVESIAAASEILGTLSPDASLRQTAIDWLKEIAAKHPDQAVDATYRCGLCYYQQGDLTNAEAMFAEASRLDPTAGKPVNALAWLYCENLAQPDKALGLLEKYLGGSGAETAEMLDTHATILLRLGRLDAAKQKLLACLDLAGQTPTFTAANYHLGLVLLKSNAADEGRSYIRRAMQLNDRVGGLNATEKQEAQRWIASSD